MKAGSFKVVFDGVEKFQKAMEALSVSNVLVGIPSDNTERKSEDEEQKMNNATIGYINEFGSDLAHIPPRPHMSVGIRNVQKEITDEFKQAAQKAFKEPSAIFTHFTRAGIIASNSIKKVITDQEGFEPLAESTLEARRAQGAKGDKALIRTGQYRNAITYVIEGKN